MGVGLFSMRGFREEEPNTFLNVQMTDKICARGIYLKIDIKKDRGYTNQ